MSTDDSLQARRRFSQGLGAQGETVMVVVCVCLACMGSLRIKGKFDKVWLSMEAGDRRSLVSGFQTS